MRTFLLKPIDDLAAALGHMATAKRPMAAMCIVLVALVATWFVYVPVHELLHVLGCVATGGSVSELQIAPQYGGALLARWLPFVVSGGDYAGRLSGFDTDDSDLVYLATDFAPFILSILIGVPLLRACTRRRRPILFGIGIVVGLAPFYNLIGDYYEMGSIITTRVVTSLRPDDKIEDETNNGDSNLGQKIARGEETIQGKEDGGGDEERIAFEGIRSDDVFKLIGDLFTRPAELGLHGPATIAASFVLVAVSLIVGILLALVTYALGDLAARITFLSSKVRRVDSKIRQ